MITYSLATLTWRLVVALLLGSILGIERTAAGKMAGLRTYALVSLGAALFIVVAETISTQYLNLTTFDPLRMAAQIPLGIGFLGAGLVIFRESKLTGLTTAAGLWLAAGVGMACGFGLFGLAIVAALLSLLVFLLGFIERPFQKHLNQTFVTEDHDDNGQS
ncbi:MAG: MgtC/SapB family protein [Patescibacteria group bacterium]